MEADVPRDEGPSAARDRENALRYLGGAARVRGPATGRTYLFTRLQPVQRVDIKDLLPLLRTRLFRREW